MSRRKWSDLKDAVMNRPGATERIAAHRAATLAELSDDLRVLLADAYDVLLTAVCHSDEVQQDVLNRLADVLDVPADER